MPLSHSAVVGWLGNVGSVRKGLKEVVSLDEVLSGTTLHDFESFLIHQECSVENLYFYTWLKDYESRFNKLSPYLQSQALPSLCKFTNGRPSVRRNDSTSSIASSLFLRTPLQKSKGLPSGVEWKNQSPGMAGWDEMLKEEDKEEQIRGSIDAKDEAEGAWIGEGEDSPSSTWSSGDYDFPSPSATLLFSRSAELSPTSTFTIVDGGSHRLSPLSPVSPTSQTVVLPSLVHPHRNKTSPPSSRRHEGLTASSAPLLFTKREATIGGTAEAKSEEDIVDELKEECERVWRTFFLPGASKELNLEEGVKNGVERGLAQGGWYPDLFAPAFDASKTMLATQSLPHFLSLSVTNINRPKQLFWYTIGTVDLLLSLLIFLLCVFLASKGMAWRSLRLLGVVFSSFGIMQTYAAYLGLCTQIQGRSSRQLHPWELDASPSQLETTFLAPLDWTTAIPLDDLHSPTPPTSSLALVFPAFALDPKPHDASWKAPPIFGPETVVADERVLDLQRRMVRDILVVGGVWAGLGTAVVLGVRGWKG